jgi:outer membrane protein assembly factor BamB
LFRLRLESPDEFQNQLFTFLDAGETDDDIRVAVLAEWHDRSVKAALEPVLHEVTREIHDTGAPSAAFLEDCVRAMDSACTTLPPDVIGRFELGIVLCRGRSLYLLHSEGMSPQFSLGAPPQPLQSTLRVRVKELPIYSERTHPGLVAQRLQLHRVFLEEEDRVVLWLESSREAGYAREEPQNARIVLLKEPAPETEALETIASGAWPGQEPEARRDRVTMSYVALALVVVVFATALFGMSRWQGIGGTQSTALAPEVLSESVDSTLEPMSPSQVSAERIEAPPEARSDEPPLEAVLASATRSSLQLLWSKRYRDWVTSSPRLIQGHVVYGCRDGRVYAVDAQGAPVWEYDSGSGIGATPEVDGTRVFCGNYAGRAFALRALDGLELWARDLGARIVASPAVGRHHVYFQTYAGDVVALEPKTGRVAWKRNIGGRLRARPLGYDQQLVVVSGDGTVLCLEQRTGEVIWSTSLGARVISNPLRVGDRVVLGSPDGHVYALSLTDGGTLWRTATGGAVNSSPATDGEGTIFVGSRDQQVYAIRIGDGSVAWRFRTGGAILSTPWVEEDRVYVTSYDRHTYVLEADAGALIAKIQLGAAIYSSPLVHDGRVFLGSNDGTFYCLSDTR